jgi:hypothetical protein
MTSSRGCTSVSVWRRPAAAARGAGPLGPWPYSRQAGCLMAQLPSAAQSRYSGLYGWLLDRERRAVAAGGRLPWSDGTPSWDGTRERLAALQRGDTVDLPLYALPSWLRVGEPLHWWRRAVVDADGAVEF